MLQVNLSTDYHSQRNNRLLPLETCGATAAVMALKASGWTLPAPADAQPEDLLTAIMLSPEGYARREQIPGGWADNIEPYRIHVVMAWAINDWLGAPDVDQFTERGTLQLMIWNLYRRKATVVNGVFAGLDHQVAVVGFTTTQHDGEMRGPDLIDLAQVTDVIIDDPYGDFRTGYTETNGNDIRLSLGDFHNITHTAGTDNAKWMHLIRRGV